jgi:cytochrome c556
MPVTTSLTTAQRNQHNRSGRRHGAFAAAIAVVGMAFLGSGTLAQDQTAATPTDTIVARKAVMDSLSEKMDDIEAAIAAGKINLDAAHADADTISIFLQAFPHLFPSATNQWKPGADRDPITDTSASPDIWAKFADFYKLATAASKSAYNASRAADDNELKKAVAELRTQCNDCHAAYLKSN